MILSKDCYSQTLAIKPFITFTSILCIDTINANNRTGIELAKACKQTKLCLLQYHFLVKLPTFISITQTKHWQQNQPKLLKCIKISEVRFFRDLSLSNDPKQSLYLWRLWMKTPAVRQG